jgi:hypothetical protein
MSFFISHLCHGSSHSVGSSKIRISGSQIRLAASHTLCLYHFDRVLIMLNLFSSSHTIFITFSTSFSSH